MALSISLTACAMRMTSEIPPRPDVMDKPCSEARQQQRNAQPAGPEAIGEAFDAA
jgi:hypothetical protein